MHKDQEIQPRGPILIAGGGLVGNTLALALAQHGASVTLVEPRAGSLPDSDPEDTRHLALAEGSVIALQRLGVWPQLDADAGPIRRVEVSRRGSPGQMRLDAAEHGYDRFGAVVPAIKLLTALETQVRSVDGIEVLSGLSVEGSAVQADHRIVRLSDGTTRNTGLIVAADGSDSPLREQAKLPTRRHDYQQSLISCSVRTERPAHGSAFERLDEDGPLALLPRPDGRMGLVWTLPTAQASERMEDSGDDFASAFQARFGYRLGRILAPGRRSLWPLRLLFAEQPFGDRLVLVGNAAQTIHPIGAQGFNLGLRDALGLAMHVAEQADPGAPERLRAYAQSRAQDRQSTLAWTSQLLAMRPGGSIVGPLAGIGLALADLVPGLQRGLIERAMGMAVLPLLPEAA